MRGDAESGMRLAADARQGNAQAGAMRALPKVQAAVPKVRAFADGNYGAAPGVRFPASWQKNAVLCQFVRGFEPNVFGLEKSNSVNRHNVKALTLWHASRPNLRAMLPHCFDFLPDFVETMRKEAQKYDFLPGAANWLDAMGAPGWLRTVHWPEVFRTPNRPRAVGISVWLRPARPSDMLRTLHARRTSHARRMLRTSLVSRTSYGPRASRTLRVSGSPSTPMRRTAHTRRVWCVRAFEGLAASANLKGCSLC